MLSKAKFNHNAKQQWMFAMPQKQKSRLCVVMCDAVSNEKH